MTAASRTTKVIETIKSVLLVVLLLFTILLLFIFWGGAAFQAFIGEDLTRHEAMDPAELLQPDRIEICFGADLYAVTDNKFGIMMDCFKAFSGTRNLSMEEISEERYNEIMRLPSIRAVFDYYLPFSALCEVYGIDRLPGADGIDAVSEFGYSADFDDRLFVFDGKSNKYYRIIGSSSNSFEALRNEIADARADSIPYFPLKTYMGGEVENYTLCPQLYVSDVYDAEYYPEIISSSLVRSFFSDNFDFVRRIEQENGTLIYMYGYGRTVVAAHHNGVLEFNREGDDRAGLQLRYLDALERASSFIAAHGAFEAENGVIFTPYIQEVIIDPDGRRGFRFIIGIKMNGARIYYESGAPVIVDVTGGRVSYFRRHLINIDQNGLAEADGREVFSAIRMLAENIEHIGEVLAEADITMGKDISFEELIGNVTRFDSGYVKTAESVGILAASWIVTIGGIEFYFGLDDGGLI